MEKGPEKLSFQRHKLMSSLMSSELIWGMFYVMHLEINVAVPELFLTFHFHFACNAKCLTNWCHLDNSKHPAT